MGYKVAVVGATGAVGREILQTLAERNFPADKVYALASSKSIGQEVSYGDDEIVTVEALDKFDFAAAEIALFSAGGDTAKTYAPIAGQAGCLVIDNSSAFRMDDDVPLVVPEVNPLTLASCLCLLKMTGVLLVHHGSGTEEWKTHPTKSITGQLPYMVDTNTGAKMGQVRSVILATVVFWSLILVQL